MADEDAEEWFSPLRENEDSLELEQGDLFYDVVVWTVAGSPYPKTEDPATGTQGDPEAKL